MRVLCVINTRSGQSGARIYETLKAIGHTGAEITLRYFHGGTTLRELVRDGSSFDRVIAAGGDGTVTGVCYALRGTNVPVLAYPAGTANLLALNLKIPSDPRRLASIAFGNHTVTLDMGEVRIGSPGALDRRIEGFLVGAGAGFHTSIVEVANDLKRSFGVSAYFMGALANLMPTISKFTLTLDNTQVVKTEGIAVLVVNVARLHFDIPLIHRGDPADGLLDVIVLRTRNTFELLPVIWAAIIDRTTGNHADRSSGVETYTAKHIVVEAEPALSVQFDGELLSATTPFEARVLAKSTRLIVPEEFFNSA